MDVTSEPKGRRPRILTRADLRFATAVVGMADFALLPEQVLPCRDIGGVATKRIVRALHRRGHARS